MQYDYGVPEIVLPARSCEFDPAFRIEREERESSCQTCRHGDMWNVVGPDDVAIGTSYEREEDAESMAEELSRAFLLGWQVATNDHANGE